MYQYILTQRLHEARRLLRNTNVSVTEAAVELGFSTPSRFASQYRRLFGELPSATRSESGDYAPRSTSPTLVPAISLMRRPAA